MVAREPLPAGEVIAAARACAALRSAHRLAVWVGDDRAVTPHQVLRPVDVPAAARVLTVPVPGRIRSAGDVADLHRPWRVALAVGFLQIEGRRAGPGLALATWPGTEDESVLTICSRALRAALGATAPGADATEVEAHLRGILGALAARPWPSPGELTEHLRGSLFDDDWDDDDWDDDAALRFLEAQRRHSGRERPLGGSLAPLIELGAVERSSGRVSITALGRWGLQNVTAREPQPIAADLTPGALLARLTGIAERDAWAAAQPWLAGRDPLGAARDLLTAAASAEPAQRITAVELVGALGPPADPAWVAARSVPTLAAHARAVAWEELSERDRAWLAVEHAAAGLARAGPDEALCRLHDWVDGVGLESLLDAVECARHPATAGLAEAVGAFLASGATPTASLAYQLKINLNRMRTPVWRRVLVPAGASLGDLHRVIQVVLDWDGDHLHAFAVGRNSYGDPFDTPELGDEERVRLRDAFAATDTVTYRYDFGAAWSVTIRRERVLDLAAGATYPVCVAGKGDAPVEDWNSVPSSTPFDQIATNHRLAESFA